MKINNPYKSRERILKEIRWLEEYKQFLTTNPFIFLSEEGQFDFIKKYYNK